DTRPNVGRRPETPQNDDGQMIDPQVSEPMANGTSAAATAAPAPEDEPQVQRSSPQGLCAAPVRDASPFEYPRPPARSIIASLPSRMAPASRSFLTITASCPNIWLSYGFAPQVVLIPLVATRSLAPYGTPCSGPRFFPATISRSACFACSRARSAVT